MIIVSRGLVRRFIGATFGDSFGAGVSTRGGRGAFLPPMFRPSRSEGARVWVGESSKGVALLEVHTHGGDQEEELPQKTVVVVRNF